MTDSAPKLPPYPPHHAAPSVGAQIERRADDWGKASRALLAEVDATERAMAARLADQEQRAADRKRLQQYAKGSRR